MRDAIHALKYGGLLPAARRLGRMLAQAIGELTLDGASEMLVIPVPLHRSKFRERGFNQARLLASEALARLRETHPGWRLVLASTTVVRQRATDSQAGLSPHQRRRNVRGAFVVADPQAVAGRNVLLIDDIMTTGATARSVAQVLLRAGASKIWIATLARARYQGRGKVCAVDPVRDLEKVAEACPAGGDLLTNRESETNQPSF